MSASQFDVLVVGEGLAGITAAANVAGAGLRVMLVSKGPGSFVLGTACVDVDGLNVTKLGLGNCGPRELEDAIASFLQFTASADCAYQGAIGERRWVPTITGTFKETSLAPGNLWKGDPRGFAKAAVVGIDGLAGFDASFVAERLAFHCSHKGLNVAYRSAVIEAPANHKHPLTTVEVANCFDRDPAYRSALVAALKPVVADAELLILPGILGMKSGDREISRFEQDIGCPVCELATLPPSVPGLRLLHRFERRLLELGVELCTGFSAQKLRPDGERCSHIVLDTPGRPREIPTGSVILAAGRFSHLLEEASSADGSEQRLRTNEELQPVDDQGAIQETNVFVCGGVLGKFEPRLENAIAILTAYEAAKLACEQGVRYAGD